MSLGISPEVRALLLPRAEELLIATLLLGCTSASDLLHPAPGVAPASLKRALAYIEERLDQPLTLEHIAAAARCSVRSLQRAFHDSRQTSVMHYVKIQRLHRVRHELRNADEARSVTDAAMRWGFLQLGQFAADYRRLFGELPSHTLRSR